MTHIQADAIDRIICETYHLLPEILGQNYSLNDVLAFVRHNGTYLSAISHGTGLKEEDIQNTLDSYLFVTQYLQPTTAPSPASNITDSALLCVPPISSGIWTSLAVIPVLLILLLLSCLRKRTREVKLFGRKIVRPGLCIPVNMVDSYENRFAFTCAFGATTTKCLTILLFGSYEEIFSPEFIEWIQNPAVASFTGIIWKIIAMLTIGIAFYPLFACMETDYNVTGFTIGFLYSAFWIFIVAYQFIQCPQYTSWVFPGDGLASEFPVFICLAFLLIKYFVLLVKTLYTKYRSIASPKTIPVNNEDAQL